MNREDQTYGPGFPTETESHGQRGSSTAGVRGAGDMVVGALQGKRIFLVSRCAWTLFNFRRGLMVALLGGGGQVVGGGAGDDGYAPRVEALGVPFVSLPVDRRGTNIAGDLRLFWSLLRWYRRERPDVVHHFTIKPVIYGSLAACLAGVPRIVNTVTGLGYAFVGDRARWLRPLVEKLYKLALGCADFTFFQNEADRSLFVTRALIKEERTGLLPGSGVDCRFFRPRSAASRPEGEIRFLMVARLLREKGVYEFVEAARRVKAAEPAARFQLLGRRDERNPGVISEQQVEEWQQEGVIKWLGEVEDVRPVMADADVVVLPSYREGTPRSLLEAAAMGKPIVTADTVGCREAVDDGVNGLLVPVRDGEALARAMLWLIARPELRRQMGVAGRLKVEREFDERRVIEESFRRYLVQERPRGIRRITAPHQT